MTISPDMQIGDRDWALDTRELKRAAKILSCRVSVLAVETDERVGQHQHAHSRQSERRIQHQAKMEQDPDGAERNPHSEKNEKDFPVVVAANVNRPSKIPPGARLCFRFCARVQMLACYRSLHISLLCAEM